MDPVIKAYNKSVKKFIKLLGNESTLSTDISKIGKRYFGKKFIGVFPRDIFMKIIKDPRIFRKDNMFIVNLDTSDLPGSHWLGIVVVKNGILIYDSFGRKKVGKLFSGKGIKIYETEYDPEQTAKEFNCGPRSLAFLDIYNRMGIESAKKI